MLEPRTRFVEGRVLEAICLHLEAVTDGRINRLLINVPPGCMKSLLVSVFWPAWEWGPMGMRHLRYLSTSFTEGSVKRDTRKMRDLIQSEWFQARWPAVQLVRGGELSFANTATGNREGVPFNSITSQRGDRFIVDDPHSTTTAESDAERYRTTRQFREGATNRLNDQVASAIVVIMQRLHESDVSGVILELETDYVHLCLPMEYEPERHCQTSIGFEDWRTEEGELLWAARFPRAQVDGEFKGIMGEYAYAGQYQQRPAPREGGMFKRAWFIGDERGAGNHIIEPHELPERITWVRHWDLAATRRKVLDQKGARTAGVRMGRSPDGRYFISDCVTKAVDGAAVRRLLRVTAEGDGYATMVSLPQDPAQAGKTQKNDLATALEGFNVRFAPEKADKEARAEPFAAQCEAGRVYLVRGPWVDAFLDELCIFPGGKRKDIPDACSGAFARLLPPMSRLKASFGAPILVKRLDTVR